jgi:hypothetical protein
MLASPFLLPANEVRAPAKSGNRRGYQCRRHGLSQQADLYARARENPRPTPGSWILAAKGASPKTPSA